MMTRYFAQVQDGIVTRVLVCDDPDWLHDRLGGEWVETADPYTSEPTEELAGVVYCGPGFGVDESFPERFAPPWVQPVATPDGWTSYPRGALVWHNGRMWKSTVDGNVWMPGQSAWHDEPTIEGVRPQWVAPTGSHDTYPLGFVVAHAGAEWESLIPANTTTPGSDPRWWKNLTAPAQPGAWAVGIAYAIGDRVTYQGNTYECRQAHTSQAGWTPTVVPALWLLV